MDPIILGRLWVAKYGQAIQYEHPSKEAVQKNEFLIEGILTFFDYDVMTHCNFPPTIEPKSRKTEKKKDHVPIERNSRKPVEVEIGELEDNNEEIDHEQVVQGPKNGKAVQTKRTKNSKHQENFIDKDEEELEVVAKKKSKKHHPAKRIDVELSDFERNVIMKNIEERKQLERELGIHTLAQELKANRTTNFVSGLDNMLNSDDEV